MATDKPTRNACALAECAQSTIAGKIASRAKDPGSLATAPAVPLADFEPVAIRDLERDRIGNRPDLWQCQGPLAVRIAAGAIFRRLQYPKALAAMPRTYKRDGKHGKAGDVTRAVRNAAEGAKMPRLLGPEDYREVFQTCAAVLCAAGLAEAERIPHAAWLACFRATRKALRVDNRAADRETQVDPEALASVAAFEPDPEAQAVFRQRFARRVSYWRACIAVARDCDPSRKRVFKWQRNRATLRRIASLSRISAGLSQAEAEKQSKDLAKLREAVAAGEAAITREAEAEAATRGKSRAAALAATLAADMSHLPPRA